MNKKGISLIMLVITIIVVIILAGAVIFSLTQSDPAKKASEAVFKSDIATFKEELRVYHMNENLNTQGRFDHKLLNAGNGYATYNEENVEGLTDISSVITSMKGKTKYIETLEIQKGELVYVGDSEDLIKWSNNIGLATKLKVLSIEDSIDKFKVRAGTNVKYTITFSSRHDITITDLNNKVVLVNKDTNVELSNSSALLKIGEVEVISEKSKKVEIEVLTSTLENANYALKLKKELVKDTSNMTNEEKLTSSFEVRTIEYEDIEIELSSEEMTNENIQVEIIYPEGVTKKEYKLDAASDFETYTTKISVDKNLTVYAKGEDSLGNVTKVATKTITNIDKESPLNTSITGLKVEESTITATLTYADNAGGSGIDITKSKYYISTESTVYATNASIWSSAKNITGLTQNISETKENGTYYVHTLSVDRAGNMRANVSTSVRVENVK